MSKVETFIRELLMVAGFASVFIGLWMIYPPAALIVCGSAFVWLGLPPRRKGGDSS